LGIRERPGKKIEDLRATWQKNRRFTGDPATKSRIYGRPCGKIIASGWLSFQGTVAQLPPFEDANSVLKRAAILRFQFLGICERPGQKIEDLRPGQKIEDLRPGQKIEDLRPGQKIEDLRPGQKIEHLRGPGDKIADLRATLRQNHRIRMAFFPGNRVITSPV